jgi:hypothetical protein
MMFKMILHQYLEVDLADFSALPILEMQLKEKLARLGCQGSSKFLNW